MPNDKAGKFHMNPKHAEQADKMSAPSGGAPSGGAPEPEPDPMADAAGGSDLVTTMAQMAQESGDMGLAEYIMAYPGAQGAAPEMAAPAGGSAPMMQGY